jgi:hypothetical protein
VVDVAEQSRVKVSLHGRLIADIWPDKGRAVRLAAIQVHFVAACGIVRAGSNALNSNAPTLIVRIALESFLTSMRLFSDWSSVESMKEPSSMNDVRSPIWMAINSSFERSKQARHTHLECLPGACANDVANANKRGANAIVALEGNTPRAVGLEWNDLPRDGILDILHLTWLRRIEHECQATRLRMWCESAKQTSTM